MKLDVLVWYFIVIVSILRESFFFKGTLQSTCDVGLYFCLSDARTCAFMSASSRFRAFSQSSAQMKGIRHVLGLLCALHARDIHITET